MDSFNLVQQRWLPVRRKGQSDIVSIAPWEIVAGDPPVVTPAAPRADWNAALLEFLVGLLQSAMPPADKKEHKTLLKTPPAPETLRRAFGRVEQWFSLFGDGHRFMQDLTVAPAKPRDQNRVGALLIDEPGGNTLKNRTDFFVKRGRTADMCPACAAMALYTLQTFAPSGGKGNRTSLRGGGPLSCIILGDTLWRTVWSNVMPLDTPEVAGAAGADFASGAVFPWATPTRTSEDGAPFMRSEGHFLQHYWGMPRRIKLHAEDLDEAAPCSVCGLDSAVQVATFTQRPYGYNYDDTWRHPLTPYRLMGMDKPALSIKGKAAHVGYADYLGIVYGDHDAQNRGIDPARAVSVYRSNLLRRGGECTLLVQGYQMDNMKPLQWCESELPVLQVADAHLTEFKRFVRAAILAADAVRSNLVQAVKKALFSEGADVSADQSRLSELSDAFWFATEAGFFERCRDVADNPEAATALREEWARHLRATADTLFEREVLSCRLDPKTMKRRYAAMTEMGRFNYGKLRTVLELPKKEKGGKAA